MFGLLHAAKSFFQKRWLNEIVEPRKVRYKKSQNGSIKVPLAGSLRGCTLVHGDYGIYVKEGVRFRTNQLEAARKAMKRILKSVKDSQLYLRVFPCVPVTKKPRETPMGGGKGSVDHYICRVPMNKIVFEIKGTNMRPELARAILWQGMQKLPGELGIISRSDAKHQLFIEKCTSWPDGIVPDAAPNKVLR